MHAAKRLLQLPAVFTTAEYCTLAHQAPATAAVMLSRYSDRGYIERLSPRSDVFANVIAGASRSTHLRAMIARAMPGAIVTGLSSIFEHGWSTQRPVSLHIALPLGSPGSRQTIPGVVTHNRSQSWFGALSADDGGISHGLVEALPRLKPEWALADMLNRMQAPDPDDIDEDALLEYRERIEELRHLLPAPSDSAKPRRRRTA